MVKEIFKIFVVEDNEWYNKLLVHNLEANPDFEVQGFLSGTEFLAQLPNNPNIVTLDYHLPDIAGKEILKQIKNHNPEIEVIIISQQDEIETAVDLLKLGASDYIVKSQNIRNQLLHSVGKIRENHQLKERVAVLEKEVGKKYDFTKSIIGNSPAIENVFALIEKAIGNNITVTITGETGTGKELVAKAIHYNSNRKNNPFIPVNMAAIPSELIESELFGHEKGAFTGATVTRKGKFEEAHGGTLFLDEIGELDMAFQAKLLRALQEKEIVKVGSNKPVKTNCRIIIATNRDLLQEVKEKKFREDLYYRLFGLPIHLPPLRDRGNDILILATNFLTSFCEENNLSRSLTITEPTKKALLSYHWPGNIRELKSVIELAAVMTNDEEIKPDNIFLTGADAVPQIISEELTLKEYNNRIIKVYLEKYDNNVVEVAKKLDIGKSTIYRMLKDK